MLMTIKLGSLHSPILYGPLTFATYWSYVYFYLTFFCPVNNHYLPLIQFTTFNYSLCVFLPRTPHFTSSVCERSAHYSKPVAKQFPGPWRRRRMALVSPCPLGDVHHPTYPKLTLKITKSVKCDNPDSCCAPSVKECFSLLSFPPPPPNSPQPRGAAPPKSIQGSEGHLLKTQNGENKNETTFSCWSWIIFVTIN